MTAFLFVVASLSPPLLIPRLLVVVVLLVPAVLIKLR
jgi:hypothetical protein